MLENKKALCTQKAWTLWKGPKFNPVTQSTGSHQHFQLIWSTIVISWDETTATCRMLIPCTFTWNNSNSCANIDILSSMKLTVEYGGFWSGNVNNNECGNNFCYYWCCENFLIHLPEKKRRKRKEEEKKWVSQSQTRWIYFGVLTLYFLLSILG